jgi:dGTPase
MNWEQLLSLKRQGDTNKRLRNEQDETRLGFDVDYDRIIFSPEFRSLQDKTQVVPLSSTDFVHTRLTHSLEVSVVARSLGRKAGVKILEKHPYLKETHGYKPNDFGAIVAAAALAHDIGNPPFGHSGEKATILRMDLVKNLKTNSTRKNTKIYVILRAMQMALKS